LRSVSSQDIRLIFPAISYA